jgi:predicted nucleotidyltransferase component of viral defense system
MAKQLANQAASVKQRLLSLARKEGRVYEIVLVRYALERFLYRLSVSGHRNRFILKGGMLVTLWLENSNRETRDADFLGFGEADQNKLKADFAAIMAMPANDGLEFDAEGLTATVIREEQEYEGVRIRTTALLEKSRIPVTIDIGFGDALSPEAHMIEYPSLLGMETPYIQTYPPALVVAEKFQAMVALGAINGRMKDYFDIWAISQSMEIAATDLDAAIAATFTRRKTDIPSHPPPGLSDQFVSDAAKQAQWQAYTQSVSLEGVTLREVVNTIWAFVQPACERLRV